MRPAIVLPWVCVAGDNHRLMLSKRQQRIILSPEYRTAQRYAESLARMLWKGPPLDGPIELRGKVYFPDNRRRDCGNYTKFTGDVLTKIAFKDDSQIHRWIWERHVDQAQPRIEITLLPLDADA